MFTFLLLGYYTAVLRIRIRDRGSGGFLPSGSGIRRSGMNFSGSGMNYLFDYYDVLLALCSLLSFFLCIFM
jgi:hypothetical protein